MRDVARTGSIRFGRFYARRFRRLLPAAFVALIVTAVVFTAISSPVEVVGRGRIVQGRLPVRARTGTSSTTRAATSAPTSRPTRCCTTGRWPSRSSSTCSGRSRSAACSCSAAGSTPRHQMRVDPDRRRGRRHRIGRLGARTPDHATPTTPTTAPTPAPTSCSPARCSRSPRVDRVGEAIRPRRCWPPASPASGPLLVLSTDWLHLDAIERGHRSHHRHVRADRRDRGRRRRAGQTRPLEQHRRVPRQGLVRHLPVALARDPRRSCGRSQPSPLATVAIACLVATGLASLSFQVLERPVRTSMRLDRHRRLVIAAGLAISLVSGLVIIPKLVDPAPTRRRARTRPRSTRCSSRSRRI